MKIKFELEEESRANKIFLKLEYMSGDADAYEYEEIEIDGVTFENYKTKLDEIKKFIQPYKLLAELTDVNHKNHCDDYDEVEDNFGEEMAIMWDNVPRDTTCSDYKSHLSSMTLLGYDTVGNKYESYL